MTSPSFTGFRFIDTLDGSPDDTLIRFDGRLGEAARAPIEPCRVHAVLSEGFEQVSLFMLMQEVAAHPERWVRFLLF